MATLTPVSTEHAQPQFSPEVNKELLLDSGNNLHDLNKKNLVKYPVSIKGTM